MLRSGAADAVVADIAVAEQYIAREGFVQLGEPLAYEENAAIVQKDNPSLLEALNNALQAVRDSGKYDELVEEWGLLGS
jgi:ABC-type amino acid transport substrate-binding protein